MLIYCAKNVLNGKLYIGSTSQSFAQRRCKHESRAFNDWSRRPFYRDLRRFGKEAFEWIELLRCSSKEQMLAYEAELIHLLDSHTAGYNVALDGGCNRGGRHSLGTRAHMSAAKREWWKRRKETGQGKSSGRPFPQLFRGNNNRDEVLAMRAKGLSYRQIARHFGCTAGAVCYADKRWSNG